VSRNAPSRLGFTSFVLCLLASNGLIAARGATDSALPSPKFARVVSVQDPEATEAFRARFDHVQRMVERGLTNLTHCSDVKAAWLSLLATQDVVGLKVYSLPGPYSGTRPAVVEVVLQGLLAAGLPPTNIIIWDRQSVDLRLAGFYDLAQRYGVRVQGSAQAGWDDKAFYEDPFMGNLVWGDLEFGKKGDSVGRKSFVSKLITHQLTKIINLSPLLNHNTAGVSGNLYSLASGSVDNFTRFEMRPDSLPVALPDIYGLQGIADRVVLNITDALICQYEGGERGLLHYSTMLNQLWFSRDPVALDVLALRELQKLRTETAAPPVKANEKIFQNAALDGVDLGIADPKRIQVEVIRMTNDE
jgi:hypothetical protein